jgi:hypothetical protein
VRPQFGGRETVDAGIDLLDQQLLGSGRTRLFDLSRRGGRG